jgi:hypothetical protein
VSRQTAERHDQLLQELTAERVAALSRISRTLESLLDQLHASAGRLASLRHAARTPELTHYREVRARAVQYRWYLEVQREALGLRGHESLDRFYRVPPPIEE